jgi:hypothetical protein
MCDLADRSFVYVFAYSCGKNMHYCCDAYHLDYFKKQSKLYTPQPHYGNVVESYEIVKLIFTTLTNKFLPKNKKSFREKFVRKICQFALFPLGSISPGLTRTQSVFNTLLQHPTNSGAIIQRSKINASSRCVYY